MPILGREHLPVDPLKNTVEIGEIEVLETIEVSKAQEC